MFTGLVREIGRLNAVRAGGAVTRLGIEAPLSAPGLALGDSLAVDGVCLTVVAAGRGRVEVEAVAETRRVATLGDWRPGRRLHLEPALRAGDPLGGHLVLGHVDGVGEVLRRERRGAGLVLTVALPGALAAHLLPKGSVALDGVSLTLDEGPFTDRFTVWLVPHTLAATKLGDLRRGDRVNIETDVLAKSGRGAETAPGTEAPEPKPALRIEDLRARGFGRSGRGRRYGG